jgi:hypothetical protein
MYYNSRVWTCIQRGVQGWLERFGPSWLGDNWVGIVKHVSLQKQKPPEMRDIVNHHQGTSIIVMCTACLQSRWWRKL